MDEPKGDLASNGQDLNTPFDLQVRSYAERHVRSYADSSCQRAADVHDEPGRVDRQGRGSGFPLAISRTFSPARNRWFDDYVTQSLKRDAIELVRVRQRQALRELFNRLLAGQTGQLLNLSQVGSDLGLDRKTIEDYVELFEDLFLIARLPAWARRVARGLVLDRRCTSWTPASPAGSFG